MRMLNSTNAGLGAYMSFQYFISGLSSTFLHPRSARPSAPSRGKRSARIRRWGSVDAEDIRRIDLAAKRRERRGRRNFYQETRRLQGQRYAELLFGITCRGHHWERMGR